MQKYNMRFTIGIPLLFLLMNSCQQADIMQEKQPLSVQNNPPTAILKAADSIIEIKKDTIDYDTMLWRELIGLDSSILLDIRYATKDNFVGEVLYDCPRCFLRPEAAFAVLAAHQELKKAGLGLKMFDCYRPRDVQWKLWEIFPQPGYVADPRKGSIHNRGGAVDLTIVDSTGQQLDMGTTFDFFGPKANHTYSDFSDEILANRQQLKHLMRKHGFSAIRSEWWHYNFRGKKYELADELWNCN